MNIVLRIERLILDGLPVEPGQGHLVQAAVEAELSHLLAEGGLAPGLESGGALPGVRADTLHLNAESKPAQMGQQIARSVYGGIGERDSRPTKGGMD